MDEEDLELEDIRVEQVVLNKQGRDNVRKMGLVQSFGEPGGWDGRSLRE